MAALILGRDLAGYPDYTMPFATEGQSVVLSASTEQHITTPPGFNRAFFVFSSGIDVWVGLNQTAVLPGASFASSTIELNPSGRQISPAGGQTLSFISPGNASVFVRFDNGTNV